MTFKVYIITRHCGTIQCSYWRDVSPTGRSEQRDVDVYQLTEEHSLSSLQTTSMDTKPTQHLEITHPHNVKSKPAFHKVTSFHQHYSTFTLQTYHHPEHRFRSWPTPTTSQSHLHTQARMQPRNT